MKYETFYTKEYFEEYARLVLNDQLGLSLIHRTDRYNSDRPDLISIDEKIGIEVTSAIEEYDGRKNKLLQQKYPTENRKSIFESEAKRLGITDGLTITKEYVAVIYSNSCKDNAKILSDTISKKVNNLNKQGFNLYKENGLFIEASRVFQEDIVEFVKVYKPDEKVDENFDLIYFFNIDGLTIWQKQQMQFLPIDESKYSEYKEKSLNYVKKLKGML